MRRTHHLERTRRTLVDDSANLAARFFESCSSYSSLVDGVEADARGQSGEPCGSCWVLRIGGSMFKRTKAALPFSLRISDAS